MHFFQNERNTHFRMREYISQIVGMLGGRGGGSPPEPAPRDPHLDHIHRAVLVARWANPQNYAQTWVQKNYAQIWVQKRYARNWPSSMAIQGPHDARTGNRDLPGGRHMYVQNVSHA